MRRRRDLGFLFLVHWALHADFPASVSSHFADTLKSFPDPGGDFTNVVVDQDSGDVFVAGTNLLYHLSSDLKIKRKVTTGPLEDAPNCPIPPYDCDTERELKDNKNHLLKMVYFSESPPILLLCGSVYNGLCQIRPTVNLDEVHWVHPHNTSLGYTRGSNRSRGTFLRGHDGQWTLFTAHSGYGLHIISRKVLSQENDEYYFHYPVKKDSASGELKPMDIIYVDVISDGFVHDGYVYFLTSLERQRTETKLLRFCHEDKTFRSYAELTISCLHNNAYHSVAKAAHFDDYSSSTNPSLYVSFASGNYLYDESILCIFPMSTIVDAFSEAPRDCDRGTFGDMCDGEVEMENGRSCGSNGTPYIVKQPLAMNSSALFSFNALSLTTVMQNDVIVLIGLDEKGSVYKVSLSTGETLAISYINPTQYFHNSFVFDREREHIYLLLEKKVFRYPVASCGVHETYAICLTRGQKDPLGCGWCKGRCTTQVECPLPATFIRAIYKKLDRIYPHKGPTSGGTQVTLFGENLDCFKERECAFIVGKRICEITRVAENVTSCITGNLTSFRDDFPESIAILIENNATYVIDKNPPSASSIAGFSHSFQYTPDPVINQLQPGFTFISGLLNVAATGLHLDSVQNPKLVVKFSIPKSTGEFEMVEDCWSDPESKGSTLTCRTPPLPEEVPVPSSSSPLLAHVSFLMDGVRKLRDFNKHQEEMSRLCYYPDPVFEKVSNIRNKTLVITGTDLYLKNLSGFQIRLEHDYFCTNLSFSVEKITCDIPPALVSNSPVIGTNITFEVFLGYFIHQIGYLTIGQSIDGPLRPPEGKNPMTSSPIWWTFLILIPLLAVPIAFMGFKRWKTKYLHPTNKANRSENLYDGLPLTKKSVETFAFPLVQGSSLVSQDKSAGSTETQVVDSTVMNLLDHKNLVIPKTWLHIGEKVGAGQFGCVFEGLLQRPKQQEKVKVAIKTLHEHSWSNPQTVESFLKEALIMKDFDHPNVLTLLGVCFEGSGPSIVLPLMENGDLCSYIRDETKFLPISVLLQFAIDVASGMAYLGEMKFVHRDLAARNCIMDSSLAVKVADFGLSRDVYMEDYYRCEDKNARLPCRWMAPESLAKHTYNSKTDVWSYGVLLWELLTRGSPPYSHVCNWDMLEYVRLGHRLDQPEHCPKSVYLVMLACWNKESKLRPSFQELQEHITCILERMFQRKQKNSQPEIVPAQHMNYYNSRELYLKMDGLVLSKDILKETFDLEEEYVEMNKVPIDSNNFNASKMIKF